MHWATIAIVLTACVAVNGRYWGGDDETKRGNADGTLQRNARGSNTCSSYYNIDQICSIRKFPKVEELYYARSFERLTTIVRESALSDVCGHFSGWFSCIQGVYEGLSEECRDKFSPKLLEREEMVRGLLKLFHNICVTEVKNTRKHLHCIANATLLMEAGDCTWSRETYGFQCNMDELYECIGEKFQETHECKAGSIAYFERNTKPIIEIFKVCEEPEQTDEAGSDTVKRAEFHSAKDVLAAVSDAFNLFRNEKKSL